MRWSSTTADGLPAVSREHLLTTLTLYWVTRTAGTSVLPYWNYRHSRHSALPADDPGPTPTAISVFGGETVPFLNLHETSPSAISSGGNGPSTTGGHFPATAGPICSPNASRVPSGNTETP